MPDRKRPTSLEAHEREVRRTQASEEATRRARWEVRRRAMACERFDHGEAAAWGDPPDGMSFDEWWNSATERERRWEVDALDKRHKWPAVNRSYSRDWVAAWGTLADSIRAVEALEKGTVRFVLQLEPSKPRYIAMHAHFCRVLRGGNLTSIAAAVARTRAQLVPTPKDVRANRGYRPFARFELGHYFNWLLSSFGPRWDPPAPEVRPAHVLHPTLREALELLRAARAKGTGVVGKVLAGRLRKSEDHTRTLIMRLKRAGYRIENKRGGIGYVLEGEP